LYITTFTHHYNTASGATEPALNETHRPDTVPGKETEGPRNPSKIANGRQIFEEIEFQLLWDRALVQDKSYSKIHKALLDGERSLPPKLQLKTKVQLPNCEIDDQGAVLQKGVLWVSD
jgi:hypothetical protein